MSFVPPRDRIYQFLHECLHEILEEGAPSQLVLQHSNAQGQDVVVLHIKSGTAQWTNEMQMADTFFRIGQRYAAGIPGAQQMQLLCFFGTRDEPLRRLPFTMQGALQFGAIPGGLATEAPNGIGQMQQQMRLLEIITQGSLTKDRHMFEMQVAWIAHLQEYIKDREARVRDAEGNERELYVALKGLVGTFVELSTKIQLEVIKAKNSAVLIQEMTRMLPFAINGVTGRTVFPVAAADSTMFRSLVRFIDSSGDDGKGKLIAELSKMATNAGPEAEGAFAMFLARLDEVRKELKADDNKIEVLASEQTGTSYVDALRDAAGDAVRKLRKSNGPTGGGTAPPAAPTPAAAPASAATVADVTQFVSPGATPAEDSALVDDLFAAGGDAISMLIHGARGKGHATLADRLQARLDSFRAQTAQPAQTSPKTE
jgi:hypothetical protein